MHFWASVAVLLSAWAAQVESASQFSQPPGAGPPNNYRDNPTYEIGERVDLQWQSDLEFMDLFLWLQWPSPVDQEVRYINLLTKSRSTSLIWTADISQFTTKIPDGQDAVFYLGIYETGKVDLDGTCHYFNITKPQVATTTSASSTTSPSTSSTSTAPPDTTTTADPGSGSDNSSDNGSKKKSSTGSVAGIAAGATVGGLAVLAGLGFLIWRHKRKRDGMGKYAPGQQTTPADENKTELPASAWPQNEPQTTEYYTPPGQPKVHGPGGIHEAP